MKGKLNGRPIRILANPNPFNQGELNFVETMFYDESAPDDECPTPWNSGALVLEEEEGGSTRNITNLLDRKRQKKEANSSRSQEHLVLGTQRQVDISLMKVRETLMHSAKGSQTTRLHDGSREDTKECEEGSTNSA